jgi:hypothetical protein
MVCHHNKNNKNNKKKNRKRVEENEKMIEYYSKFILFCN